MHTKECKTKRKLNLSTIPCEYKWVNVTKTAAFAPRDGAGALVYKDKMWLIGGWNPYDKKNFPLICNNEVWSSIDGREWILEKANTFAHDGTTFDRSSDWEGRHTAGYEVFKDKMWIIGGDANQGHCHADVWNSTNGKDWSQVNLDNPVPWGSRVGFLSFVFNGKIWILGGQSIPQFAPAEERFYNDIWNTSDGINWEKVVPKGNHWTHRGLIGGNVVFKDRMWILGGGTYDTPKQPKRKFYNDVWSSGDGINWEKHLDHAPWHPREYHDVAVYDNKMWVLEGWNQGNRNDVWYSSDGENWLELPETPWSPRHASSIFVYDDALWVVTGNNLESDVWKLQRNPSLVL